MSTLSTPIITTVVMQSMEIGGDNITFEASLLNNLDDRLGSTPTFARASAGTVPDHEGILRQETTSADSIGARHWGARRVENLVFQSQDFSVSWSTTGSASWSTHGVTDPDGGSTASTAKGGGTGIHFQNPIGVDSTADTYINSLWLKRRTGTGQINIIGPNESINAVTITSSWVRYPFTSAGSATKVRIGIRIDVDDDEVDVAFAQVELVSGQSVQTPGEYQATTTKAAHQYYPLTLAGAAIPEVSIPATNGMRGLIVEEARENLCLYFGDLTNAAWNETDTDQPSSNSPAPDGSLTADEVAATSTDDIPYAIYQAFTGLTATDVTTVSGHFSLGTNATMVQLAWDSDGSGADGCFCNFNISTGANGTATALAAGTVGAAHVEALPNDIYRFAISGSIAVGTVGRLTISIVDDIAATVFQAANLTDNDSIIATWFGVEVGAWPSTPIATTTGSVTRVRDDLTYDDDTVVSDVAMSAYVEVTPFHTQVGAAAAVLLNCDNGSNAQFLIRSGTYRLRADDGTNNADITPTNAILTLNKFAVRASTTTSKMQVLSDGTAGAEATYDGAWDRDAGTLYIGGTASAQKTNNCIKNVKIWDTDKGTAFLEAETT